MEYSYRPSQKRNYLKIALSITVILIGLMSVFLLLNYSINLRTPLDLTEPRELGLDPSYVPIKLLGLGTGEVLIGTECKQILIPITNDQAFSISNGLTKEFARPLTHDMMKTVLDNFEIKPTRFSIDRWENELWYATLRFQKGFNILDLDIRPSDGLAMSVRYNLTMYIHEDTFDKKAKNVC